MRCVPSAVHSSKSDTINFYSRLLAGLYSASRAQPAVDDLVKQTKADSIRQNVSAYRHVYPEFLPDPNIKFRNEIREKLERNDMIARRTQIDIPEFYVGE